MKQPKPVTFLAAELMAACKTILPGRAAITAEKLCHIGRRFTKLAERSVNGLPEDKDSEADQRLENLEKQCSVLVHGMPARIERSALHLVCVTTHTRRGQRFEERTSLI